MPPEEDEEGHKHLQTSVRWADIETGEPPQQHEIEAVEEEEEFPPLSYEKTKLEHLLEPLVPDQETDEASVNEEIQEIDTLEAHAELIKKREQIKIELHAMKDQPNPFLPEGEVAKDAQGLVEKMKTKGNKHDNSNLEYESLSIESPMHSEDFASTELNFEDESPRKSESFTMTVNDNATKTEAIVNRELILSAKTDAVERVVIPEKTSGCCCIL